MGLFDLHCIVFVYQAWLGSRISWNKPIMVKNLQPACTKEICENFSNSLRARSTRTHVMELSTDNLNVCNVRVSLSWTRGSLDRCCCVLSRLPDYFASRRIREICSFLDGNAILRPGNYIYAKKNAIKLSRNKCRWWQLLAVGIPDYFVKFLVAIYLLPKTESAHFHSNVLDYFHLQNILFAGKHVISKAKSEVILFHLK